jgi:hypothetical protein
MTKAEQAAYIARLPEPEQKLRVIEGGQRTMFPPKYVLAAPWFKQEGSK